MKKIYTSLFLFVLLNLCMQSVLMSQVSVNSDGSLPDPSAMLEVKSDSLGLLLPRVDYNNRPTNPATGLMIYFTLNAPFGSGLYYYNDTTWLKISLSSTYLGQAAWGGIIFYIDYTGIHGLVAAPMDQGWEPWGCDSVLIGPGAQHLEIGYGDTNTAAIVAGCPESNFAAKLCDDLELNGYSDWYLPSKDEQDSLMVNRYIVGGFVEDDWYWSSSEADSTGAVMKINNPAWIYSWTSASKSYSLNVRCIRKF